MTSATTASSFSSGGGANSANSSTSSIGSITNEDYIDSKKSSGLNIVKKSSIKSNSTNSPSNSNTVATSGSNIENNDNDNDHSRNSKRFKPSTESSIDRDNSKLNSNHTYSIFSFAESKKTMSNTLGGI